MLASVIAHEDDIRLTCNRSDSSSWYLITPRQVEDCHLQPQVIHNNDWCLGSLHRQKVRNPTYTIRANKQVRLARQIHTPPIVESTSPQKHLACSLIVQRAPKAHIQHKQKQTPSTPPQRPETSSLLQNMLIKLLFPTNEPHGAGPPLALREHRCPSNRLRNVAPLHEMAISRHLRTDHHDFVVHLLHCK